MVQILYTNQSIIQGLVIYVQTNIIINFTFILTVGNYGSIRVTIFAPALVSHELYIRTSNTSCVYMNT